MNAPLYLSSAKPEDIPVKLESLNIQRLKDHCPEVMRNVLINDGQGKIIAGHLGWDHLKGGTEAVPGCRALLRTMACTAPVEVSGLKRGANKALASMDPASLGEAGAMYMQGQTAYRGAYKVRRPGTPAAEEFRGRVRTFMCKMEAKACEVAPDEVKTGGDRDIQKQWGIGLHTPTFAFDTGLIHPVHDDKKDCGLSFFSVVDDGGPVAGGEFALPQLGVAFNVCDGDMVLFDPALQHATCHSWPLLRLRGGARRVSGCLYQSRAARTSAAKHGAVHVKRTRKQNKRTKSKNKKNNKKKKRNV
jgi:hypothetical protein